MLMMMWPPTLLVLLLVLLLQLLVLALLLFGAVTRGKLICKQICINNTYTLYINLCVVYAYMRNYAYSQNYGNACHATCAFSL